MCFAPSATRGCRAVSTPTSPASDNAQISGLTPGTADIAIEQLVDANGLPLAATIVLVLPATCNGAHTLNLTSANGGLLGDGPVLSGPFRSSLPYSITVDWAGGRQAFQTLNLNFSFDIGDAATGPVTVTINIPSGGAPLAAGAYSDELVLELGVAG